MNKQLLALVQPELTEKEIRELCRAKKDELGFDIEKALFPLNPFSLAEPKISLEDAVGLAEKWSEVRAAARAPVGVSVGDSVWCSERGSVNGPVGALVWDSVLDSVWGSVLDSVGASVGASVLDSVGASVWGYVSSIFYGIEKWKFIEHEKGANPFQPAIDLWESGYVASRDGGKWRLHCGVDAKVVWEGNFGDNK